MFRFNFNNSEENEEQDNPANHKSDIPDLSAEEIFINSDHLETIKSLPIGNIDLLILETTSIKYLSQHYLQTLSSKEQHIDIFSKVSQLHSDLIPGEYEGGLKIWEGALDLVDHLSATHFSSHNLKVLELGCGAGFPGILMLKKGAKVDFQDYNADVLNYFTLPNVLLNCPEEEWEHLQTKCRFISGDWSSVDTLLLKDIKSDSEKYDLILSAETIYNPDNHTKLINLMGNVLKSTGKILIAAKVYYFGVGGSIYQFEKLLKSDKVLKLDMGLTVKNSSSAGVERVIMQISRISS